MLVSDRISRQYEHHLSFAERSDSIGPAQPKPDPNLGQRERSLSQRRKNAIWDAYFPGGDLQGTEKDRGWDAKVWQSSLHALNAETINIEPVLPTRDKVSQNEGDELYLALEANYLAYMW
jgi:hypothetical protein